MVDVRIQGRIIAVHLLIRGQVLVEDATFKTGLDPASSLTDMIGSSRINVEMRTVGNLMICRVLTSVLMLIIILSSVLDTRNMSIII